MGHNVYGEPSEDQGPLLNLVSMTQYSIAVLFVMLRFFTRGIIVKKFGLDDLFIAIAVVLGSAQTATIVLQVEHGRGRHAMSLLEDEFNQMLMYKWINMLVYLVANWAVKMSILALYQRIGSGKQGLPFIVRSRMIGFTAGIITAFTIAAFLVQLFSCMPIALAWDVQHMQDPGSCINAGVFMRVQGAVNVFTDVVLLLYPLPLLPLLKFNRGQHTALAIIFSIGLVPVAASTIRLCEIAMSGTTVSSEMPWQEADSSWTWAWIPVWSQIEVDIGILTACLPCLSPLLRLVWTEVSPPLSPSARSPSMLHLPRLSVWEADAEKAWDADAEKAWEQDRWAREKSGWDGLSREAALGAPDAKWTAVAAEKERLDVVAVVERRASLQRIGVAVTRGERGSVEGRSWFYDDESEVGDEEGRGRGRGPGRGRGDDEGGRGGYASDGDADRRYRKR